MGAKKIDLVKRGLQFNFHCAPIFIFEVPITFKNKKVGKVAYIIIFIILNCRSILCTSGYCHNFFSDKLQSWVTRPALFCYFSANNFKKVVEGEPNVLPFILVSRPRPWILLSLLTRSFLIKFRCYIDFFFRA